MNVIKHFFTFYFNFSLIWSGLFFLSCVSLRRNRSCERHKKGWQHQDQMTRTSIKCTEIIWWLCIWSGSSVSWSCCWALLLFFFFNGPNRVLSSWASSSFLLSFIEAHMSQEMAESLWGSIWRLIRPLAHNGGPK